MTIKKDTKNVVLSFGLIAAVLLLGETAYVPPFDSDMDEASVYEVAAVPTVDTDPSQFDETSDTVPVNLSYATITNDGGSESIATTPVVPSVSESIQKTVRETAGSVVPKTTPIPVPVTNTPVVTPADIALLQKQIEEAQKLTDALAAQNAQAAPATDVVTAPPKVTKAKASRRSRAS